MNIKNENQDLDGNYEIHIPYKPNKLFKFRCRIIEPEYDEQTAQKISEAHELAKRKAMKSERNNTKGNG